MSKTIEYSFNGYAATVITPDKPNGKWIWKTEFLYAFDKAEQALVEDGYTRVNYKISDMYGSYNAVRLMHAFHLDLRFVKKRICSDSVAAGCTPSIIRFFTPNTWIKSISTRPCSILLRGRGKILPNRRGCSKSIA